SPYSSISCGNLSFQQWTIQKGPTNVTTLGSNGLPFCLDAGTSPKNGDLLKVWDCYDNLPAQTWYYTDDNRIALKDQGFCVDLPNGNATDEAPLQIWQCSDNNPNQVWIQETL
ncbi:ricin B lectin, partial [Pluteus cervinus]